MKLPYYNLLPDNLLRDHRNFRNHNPYRKTEIWTPLRSVILLKGEARSYKKTYARHTKRMFLMVRTETLFVAINLLNLCCTSCF